MSWVRSIVQAFGNVRAILLSLALTLLCLGLFHPYRIAFDAASSGQALPDLLGFVGPSTLHAHLIRLGDAGRQAYWPIACIDMLFPFAYGSLMIAVAAWGLRDRRVAGLQLAASVGLPILVVAADLVENLLAQRAIAIFPKPLALRGWLWAFAHALKWTAVSLAIVGCLGALLGRFRSTVPSEA